jgi:transcriptional regulator with AAA-type ATPase domain
MAELLRAAALTHSGQFASAQREIGEAAVLPSELGSRATLLASEYLGDVHLEQGHAEAALRCYDEVWPRALALVPQGDIVAELRRRRAECYHLLGRFEDAHREALAGLDHCRELGDRYEEAATYRVLALSTASTGKPSDAKKWFDQGFAYYDDIETPYEWGKLWLAYGDWLRGPHAGEYTNPSVALEAYQAAAEHFERMGAQARLEEANARIVAASPAAVAKKGGASSATPGTGRKGRPARRPRAAIELERRADWAIETFGFVTRDPAVLTLLEEVAKLAKSDAPILVLGESGTGKELVASGVHRLSGRAGLFVPINCGAIPRDMIESELFGHVAGAFTGATRDKPGILETCDGGTVFLDEIGEMSQDLQSRLLRFLERSEARRVGANRNYSVDTRVVAATNRDRGALERGEGFRPDLYYRLAHAVITLPPLRRRPDDLPVLVTRFMAEFCSAEGRDVELSDAALSRLMRHPWPGNVRQLRAVLRRAVLLAAPGRAVCPEDLQLDDGFAPTTLSEELEQAEKARILQALASAQGSKTIAAKALGMPRTTLITRMQRYGLM